MKTKYFTHFSLFVLSITVLLTLMISRATTSEICPISDSIYRDANGQGFELVFGPPPVGSAVHGTAVIDHPQQAQLYQFRMFQSSGYGTVWLWDKDPDQPDNDWRFWIAFFDQDLASATPLYLGAETEAPQYAVVAGLGSHDHYQRRGSVTEETPPLLGDTMWIRDRCQ